MQPKRQTAACKRLCWLCKCYESFRDCFATAAKIWDSRKIWRDTVCRTNVSSSCLIQLWSKCPLKSCFSTPCTQTTTSEDRPPMKTSSITLLTRVLTTKCGGFSYLSLKNCIDTLTESEYTSFLQQNKH